MNTNIKIAWIGVCSAVSAAMIAGIFSLVSDKGKTDVQGMPQPGADNNGPVIHVKQTTQGDNSPAIVNHKGNITINGNAADTDLSPEE